jgi:hypothetical protein
VPLVHAADYRNAAPYAGRASSSSAPATRARRSPSTLPRAARRTSYSRSGRRRASSVATRSVSRARCCGLRPRVCPCRSSTGSQRAFGGSVSRT